MLSNHTTKLGLLSRKKRIVCLTVYPVGNNKDCRKKISKNPGSKIVHCLHCNKAMLLKNCYTEMNINFHLEKQEHHFSVTAFPKIMGNFLQEVILQYKDTMDDLTEKTCCRKM